MNISAELIAIAILGVALVTLGVALAQAWMEGLIRYPT